MDATATAPPRLRYALALTFGLWLTLRQVDGVLVRLQGEGHGSYGVNDLGPLIPKDLPNRVGDLLAVWEKNSSVAHTAFGVYTGLDLLFIVAYLVLIAQLTVWLPAAGSALNFAIAAAAADVAEDLIRILMVGSGHAWPAVAWVAWIVTVLKWLMVLCVVLVVLDGWRQVGLSRGPGELTPNRRWAVRRLRIPAALIGAWGLLLIFDPTGQAPDTFRRWLNDPGRFAASAAGTFGAALLLGFATWTTARRSVLAHFDVTLGRPRARSWAVAFAVLVCLAAWKPGWHNLGGIAITIAVVFVLGLLARHRGLPDELDAGPPQKLKELAASPPNDGRREQVQRVAAGLSVLPIVALLFALTSAWTAPAVVLFALEHDLGRAWAAALLGFGGLALVPVATAAGTLLLRSIDDARGLPTRNSYRLKLARYSVPVWPDKLEVKHATAAALCLVVCAAAIAWPIEVPPFIGVVAVTAISFAALLVVLAEAQRYGETHVPPRGLTMIGFTAIPTTVLLVLTFIVASIFNDGSYHAVERNGKPAPAQAGTSLTEVFDGWAARNCLTAADPHRLLPMVFVASQGGGIRAAYWTTSVLTKLLGAPARSANDAACPDATRFDRVLALSGASGGSLGVTSYAGQVSAAREDRWYRKTWGKTDFAAVPTSWGLLVDLPRNLIGFDAPDRARRFEEAWEERDPTLSEDFFASQRTLPAAHSTPVLMLAGTQVESGCRVNVSPLRLTPRRSVEESGECAALADRPAVSTESGAVLPGAALTSDIVDYLCGDGGSINRSTAALISGRFPYVSPSGQLVNCDSDRPTALVDGGYAENTGAQAVLNLWGRLAPTVAAHNAAGRGARIVPIFVDVDNHYAKASKAGTVGRTQEVLVPPLTAGRPDKLDDRGVEQQAKGEFSLELPGLPGVTCRIGGGSTERYVTIAPPESPGVPAPLAWTLSDMAMDDLDRQRGKAFEDERPANALRKVLAGGEISCRRLPDD